MPGALTGRSGVDPKLRYRPTWCIPFWMDTRCPIIEDTLLADGSEIVVASGAGYRVTYAIAEDNLRLGRTVIADSTRLFP